MKITMFFNDSTETRALGKLSVERIRQRSVFESPDLRCQNLQDHAAINIEHNPQLRVISSKLSRALSTTCISVSFNPLGVTGVK